MKQQSLNNKNNTTIISACTSLAMLCLIVISGCSSSAKAPTTDVFTSSPAYKAQAIEIQTSKTTEELQAAPKEINNANAITELERLINDQDFGGATELSLEIDESRMALKDQSRLNLSKATLAATQNDNEGTINFLNKVQHNLLNRENTASYYWLKARAMHKLGNTQKSLESLASRSNYLNATQVKNNDSMMKSIASAISEKQRRHIARSTPNQDLVYWLQATSFNNNNSISPLNHFEGNTKNAGTLNRIKPTWTADSPKNIAVLLPFNSQLAAMAAEFKKGFSEAHELNTSTHKPQISFYDVGSGDIDNKIELAFQNNSDFIVGPLGNQSSNIALYNRSNIPIMAIGGNLQEYINNRYTFSLNPEADSIAIANHARGKGLSHAIVFSPNNSRGERLSSAFENAWTMLNGTYEHYQYNSTDFDHSAIIKHALGIYDSENRYSKLSATIGMRPKFTSSRKSNIDMIFLASNLKDTKNLKPQLNYFDAHKVPTYGPSNINSLNSPSSEKADLDGLIIPEMTAVIEYDKSINKQNNSSEKAIENNNEEPETIEPISRLSILGFDAYQAISIIPELETQNYTYEGKSGKLTITPNGNVHYQHSWAKFTNGTLKKIR